MGRTAEILRLKKLLERRKFFKQECGWVQKEIGELEELQEIERRAKKRKAKKKVDKRAWEEHEFHKRNQKELESNMEIGDKDNGRG